VLRVLRDSDTTLSLGQIAKQLTLPRSTVQRLVNSLLNEGFVASNGDAGGYRLGTEILLLANSMKKDVSQELHSLLERLAKETGETVDLAIYQRSQMIFIDQVVGTHRIRTVSAIGQSFPMSVTANGKAALALLNEDDLQVIYSSERTLSDPSITLDSLSTTLQEVRLSGFALDIDEHTSGLSAVGISFFINQDLYAVSIPAPTNRFLDRKDYLIQQLLQFKKLVKQLFPSALFSAAK